MPLHHGQRFIGGKLVGDRPARRARQESQPLLVGARFELVDHAVDLVRQARAPRAERAVVLEAPGDAAHHAHLRRDRQAERAQPLEQLALAGRLRCALERAQAVEDRRQRSRGADARVELAQTPGGRIARIDEDLLALLARPGVHARKARERHEHLPARLEQARRGALQALRHRADGAHVGGHVLAGDAVATRGGLRELTVAVDHRHRQAVELRLRDVLQLAAHAEPLVDAPVERRHVLLGEGVVEREHRHLVHDLAEGGARGARDALRRGIGRDEFRDVPPRARAGRASGGRTRRPAPPDHRARSSGSRGAPAAGATRRPAPPPPLSQGGPGIQPLAQRRDS